MTDPADTPLPRAPGEPPYKLIDNWKHEAHSTSGTGATMCATAVRCPRAAFYDLQVREERKPGLSDHYPFARGTMAHTLALHLAIRCLKPSWWERWADSQTATMELLRTGSPKNQATLKKNFFPLIPAISHQIIQILGADFEGCELYAAESVLSLAVNEDQVYTPLVDLTLYNRAANIYHFIDWKTSSLEKSALKGLDEWDAKTKSLRVIRSGTEFFYSAEAQFQWMYLLGDEHFPEATVKVWVGLIRLVKGQDPEVEMVPIQRGGPEWRASLEKAMDFDGTHTPGQGACYTPYGPCDHWNKCYPEVVKAVEALPVVPVETVVETPEY